MKKIMFLVACFLMVIPSTALAHARDGFVKGLEVYVNGDIKNSLSDNNFDTTEKIKEGDTIEITSPSKLNSIYIIYSVYSAEGYLTYDGTITNIGENSFLHEFIELKSSPTNLDITYKKDVIIKEIFSFTESTPEWVQKWEPPLKDTDLLVISAHNDDEQLFFAGIVPKTLDEGRKVQIMYFTIHSPRPIRMDEELDGLWAYGMKNYPIIGILPDSYSMSLNKALAKMKDANLTEDDLIKFDVDTIRKIKPEVIITHDEKGEYGHGQHQLATYILKKAIPFINDNTYKSDYNPFEVQKVYIHLYKENPIVMDYDIPLKSFGGKTAFEMSMYSFSKHESQQYLEWAKWQNLSSAKDVPKYNPCYYGLYYSTVGYVNEDNNMFYNVKPVEQKNKIKQIDEKTTQKSERAFEEERTNDNTDDFNSTIKTIMIILFIALIILDIALLLVKKAH